MTAHAVLWLLPVLMLPVCLWMTRRLRYEVPVEAWTDARRSGPAVLICGALYCILALVGIGVRVLIPLAMAVGMLTFALHLQSLDRRRRASPARVGVAVFLLAYIFAMPGAHLGVLRDQEVRASGVLIGAVLLAMLAIVRQRRSGELTATQQGSSWVLLAIGGCLLVVLSLSAWNARTYGSPEQLEAFVESFADPASEIGDWPEMGHAAAALQRMGIEPDTTAAAEEIRDALKHGVDIHPSTLMGAQRAGLLRPEDWTAVREQDRQYARRRARLVAPMEKRRAPGMRASEDLWALLHDPTFTEAEAATVAGQLALGLPTGPGIGNLEDARESVELLVAMDREDLVREARPLLHAVLVRSWCVDVPSFTRPYGFSSIDDPAHEPTPRPEANIHAIVLMRHVGVPEGVDLPRFAQHLQGDLRPSLFTRAFKLHPLDAERATALQMLRHDQPDAFDAHFVPERDLPLLAALAPLLLGLILLLRRPIPEPAQPDEV